MKTYLCIDPGASGGWVFKCPGVPALSGNIDSIGEVMLPADVTVVIENVPPFVGRFIPSSAAFKLGYSFGWLVGYFRHYKVVLVRPQEWQKTLALGTTATLAGKAWKGKLKQEAQRRYPSNKSTLKTADAFCLLAHAEQHNL